MGWYDEAGTAPLMKVCVLGSGSSGNSIYVACDGFAFLIDAGLGIMQLRERLAAAGSSFDDIQAILISHEHHDHIRGLAAICKKRAVRVYANRHTAVALMDKGVPAGALVFFRTGISFTLGPMEVHPFPVPHDARDPVGFIVSAGGCRIGIATDLGSVPDTVREILRGCRALVIESNHEDGLLWAGARPLSLKARIVSTTGHLSNEAAAALLADIASEELRDIFLAHLSSECNRPDEALASAGDALRAAGFGHVAVRLTFPDRPSEVVEYACPREGVASPG